MHITNKTNMRKTTSILIILFITVSTISGQIKYGFRGGVNSSQLKLNNTIDLITPDNQIQTLKIEAKSAKAGLHAGGLVQIMFANYFIQPEILFTTTGGELEVTIPENNTSKLIHQRFYRLDIPVLGGFKIGPARIGLGPVASFNLYSNDELSDMIQKSITREPSTSEKFEKIGWGMQIGAGLNIFGKIAIDVKYEFGLSNLGSGVKIDEQMHNYSQRNNQLIFSVGYFLN